MHGKFVDVCWNCDVSLKGRDDTLCCWVFKQHLPGSFPIIKFLIHRAEQIPLFHVTHSRIVKRIDGHVGAKLPILACIVSEWRANDLIRANLQLLWLLTVSYVAIIVGWFPVYPARTQFIAVQWLYAVRADDARRLCTPQAIVLCLCHLLPKGLNETLFAL